MTTGTRIRRTDEQLVADLEAEIQRLKNRAAQQKVKRSPAIGFTLKAVKSIDTALATTDDSAMRGALHDARTTLSACLSLQGVLVASGSTGTTGVRVRRSTEDKEQLADVLYAHIQKNSGQRGEQIAAALGTDVNTMRPVMKNLIAAQKVKTRGERRGMQYFAA